MHILGFQSEDVVFYEKEFNALGDTHIVTVDGTRGTEGFVTNVMEKLSDDFATYYSCGPMPMLKAVQEMYREKKVSYHLKNVWAAVWVHVLHVFAERQKKLKQTILKFVQMVQYFQQGWWHYEQISG